MWFLWELFDDVVDITAGIVKVPTSIVDSVIESDMTGTVDDIKDSVKR